MIPERQEDDHGHIARQTGLLDSDSVLVLAREFLCYNLSTVSSRRDVRMARIIRISKEEAQRRLADVPDDKRFWCRDGRNIKSLGELGKALVDISDDTYHHHSGEGRNDFSKWVREVVGDGTLANELSKAKSRMHASHAVAKRISFLEGKL